MTGDTASPPQAPSRCATVTRTLPASCAGDVETVRSELAPSPRRDRSTGHRELTVGARTSLTLKTTPTRCIPGVIRVISGRVALRAFDRGRGARRATGRDSNQNFADDRRPSGFRRDGRRDRSYGPDWSWSCPVLTDTPCKGLRTLKVSVNSVFVEEAGAAGEEVSTAVVEAATT